MALRPKTRRLPWSGPALVLITLFPAIAQRVPHAGSNTPTLPPTSLAIVNSLVAVPVAVEGELLYLPGRIGNSPELAFVVDTSATASSVDPEVAHAAGLAPSAKAKLEIARRTLPPSNLKSASTSYIRALSGRPTAGVLGEPEMHRYSLSVDFDRHVGALLSPDICPSSAAKLPLKFAGGLPFVEGTLVLPGGETASGLFLFDTAQTGPGIVLAPSFVAAHPGLAAGPKVEEPASGKTPAATLVRLKGLKLGPLTLEQPIAEIGHEQAAGGDPRLAGVLGLEAIRRFNFVLNQQYATLYLEPGRRMQQPFEADMSGLVLRAGDDGKLAIAAVIPGSPAAEAHLAPGDLLLRMEGKSLTGAELGSVTRALRSTPGAAVHLEVAHEGSPRTVQLRLRRML